ncbi:hypothetical protein Ntsu_21440 [Nocardia sp. IFM 10818]
MNQVTRPGPYDLSHRVLMPRNELANALDRLIVSKFNPRGNYMIPVIIDTGSAALNGLLDTGSAALHGLLNTLWTGSFGK